MNATRLQIRMSAGDVARAAAFYRDGLDLHVAMETPTRCELTCAGARIVLTLNQSRSGAPRETGFAVEVHSLEPAIDLASGSGKPVTDVLPPPGDEQAEGQQEPERGGDPG